MTIFSGKQTIAKQLTERDKVISREEQEKNELSRQLLVARQELQHFQEENPDRVELADWRERFITGYIDQHQPMRKSLLLAGVQANGTGELRRLVRTHLGWVYLLQTAGQPAQALEHAAEARRLLSELQIQHPEVGTWRVMLAECLQDLSELQTELGQGEQAALSAAAALELRVALTREHPDLLAYQLEEFASRESQLALLGTGTSSTEEKKQLFLVWQKLKNDLQQKLSANAEDFYSLACYLTLREPRLGNDLPTATAGQILEQREVDWTPRKSGDASVDHREVGTARVKAAKKKIVAQHRALSSLGRIRVAETIAELCMVGIDRKTNILGRADAKPLFGAINPCCSQHPVAEQISSFAESERVGGTVGDLANANFAIRVERAIDKNIATKSVVQVPALFGRMPRTRDCSVVRREIAHPIDLG